MFFSPPSVGSYYRDGVVYYSDLWCSHQWLDVELEAIPYDTWRYIMAEEYDSEGPVIPLVYEPTLFPSNVKGGLGYVSISSATISTIQLPDVYFDVDHYPGGYIKFITDEIKKAIGKEQDDYIACVLNVQQSIRVIESSLEIQKDEEKGLKVIGAIYNIENGTVEFGV